MHHIKLFCDIKYASTIVFLEAETIAIFGVYRLFVDVGRVAWIAKAQFGHLNQIKVVLGNRIQLGI